MTKDRYRLLAEDEPAAVSLQRHDGASPFVLACDHAVRQIPRRLGTLGLGEADRRRHIAWDVGAAAVATRLSAGLDAALICQTYSRLVIDCNRAVDRPDAMPKISETTEIPGNQEISDQERAARIAEIHAPYHQAVAGLLDHRRAAGRDSVLLCVHSFTPVFKGQSRPWHIGLLYNRDRRLADALHRVLAAEEGLCVGDNQPYAISDESDYTVPVHGEKRGLVHIEIEIRHDLIETPENQALWADKLQAWLLQAHGTVG